MSFDLEHLFGIGRLSRLSEPPTRIEHVITHQPLQRVLAFTGRTIDDVVNDPIAKREVLGYYKLHRWVERQTEVGELKRQWNAVS